MRVNVKWNEWTWQWNVRIFMKFEKKSELKFEKNGATVWLTRKKNSFEKNFCGREIFWSADDDFAAEFRSAVGYVDR